MYEARQNKEKVSRVNRKNANEKQKRTVKINIQNNLNKFPVLIQNMNDKEFQKLSTKWDEIENQLDKLYIEDSNITIPIASELEAIRTMLRNSKKIDYKIVKEHIGKIEKWIRSPLQVKTKGIILDDFAKSFLGFPLLQNQLNEETIYSDDFLVEGIITSALLDSSLPKEAEHEVIQDFEDAINSKKINWKAFIGKTHNNIPLGNGKTCKAHFQGKDVKLYIDPSAGVKSKFRAIYKLEDKKLRFSHFEQH